MNFERVLVEEREKEGKGKGRGKLGKFFWKSSYLIGF